MKSANGIALALQIARLPFQDPVLSRKISFILTKALTCRPSSSLLPGDDYHFFLVLGMWAYNMFRWGHETLRHWNPAPLEENCPNKLPVSVVNWHCMLRACQKKSIQRLLAWNHVSRQFLIFLQIFLTRIIGQRKWLSQAYRHLTSWGRFVLGIVFLLVDRLWMQFADDFPCF